MENHQAYLVFTRSYIEGRSEERKIFVTGKITFFNIVVSLPCTANLYSAFSKAYIKQTPAFISLSFLIKVIKKNKNENYILLLNPFKKIAHESNTFLFITLSPGV
jgi:hypothetical protein